MIKTFLFVFVLALVLPLSSVSAQSSLTSEGSGQTCGNNSDPGCSVCSTYNQSGYWYGQSGYYSQSGYYNQSAYYSQNTYYLQGGYWAPISQATITLGKALLPVGATTTISWNGGNAAACTVSGGGINSSAISGSQVITANGQAVFSISCSLGPNISQASTTLNVLPALRESNNTNSIFDFLDSKITAVALWIFS